MHDSDSDDYDYEISDEISTGPTDDLSTLHAHCNWTPERPWFSDSADVTLEVGGHEYRMHSVMLTSKHDAGGSVRFRRHCVSGNADHRRIVLPVEVDRRGFEIYAAFLYNGRSPVDLTASEALSAYKTAVFMRCPALKALTATVLRRHVSLRLAFEVWRYDSEAGVAEGVEGSDEAGVVAVVGDGVDARFFLDYLLRNGCETLRLDECVSVEACHLRVLLADNRLNVCEIDVAKFSLRWATYAIGRRASADLDSVVSDAISLLACARYELLHIDALVGQVYADPTVSAYPALRRALEREWRASTVRHAHFINGMMVYLPSSLMKIRPRVCPHQVNILTVRSMCVLRGVVMFVYCKCMYNFDN